MGGIRVKTMERMLLDLLWEAIADFRYADKVTQPYLDECTRSDMETGGYNTKPCPMGLLMMRFDSVARYHKLENELKDYYKERGIERSVPTLWDKVAA